MASDRGGDIRVVEPTGLFAMLLCVALAVIGCGGPAQPRFGPLDNVVIVSIDSLRADHVGAYGYPLPTTPTIDGLAASGVLFERAYATTSWTLPSYASLLTGLDSAAHGVSSPRQRLPDRIDTLAERLAQAGVHTVGFFSGPYLDPSFGLARGFAEYVDCTSYADGRTHALLTEAESQRLESLDEETRSLASAHLASHRDVTNPILLERLNEWLSRGRFAQRNFLFLHLWDVHFDYIPPARHLALFDPDYEGPLREEFFAALRVGMPARDFQHVVARYDAEIRFTDETLGEILRALDEHRLLENAAVIVTSDHGEEFLDHGAKGHRGTLYEEVLRVPLVMRLEGWHDPGQRIREVVSLADLFATVCDLFGVSCPDRGAGRSLLPLLEGRDTGSGRGDALADLRLMGLRQLALVRQSDKVIRFEKEGVTLYYDREALEEERDGRTVGPAAGDPARAASQRLDERIREARALAPLVGGAPVQAGKVSRATLEMLRALGYLPEQDAPTADPPR